jgi:hypothetical protein
LFRKIPTKNLTKIKLKLIKMPSLRDRERRKRISQPITRMARPRKIQSRRKRRAKRKSLLVLKRSQSKVIRRRRKRKRRMLQRKTLLCMSRRTKIIRRLLRIKRKLRAMKKRARTIRLRRVKSQRRRPRSKDPRLQEMRTRSQESPEFSRTSILSTITVTGREALLRCSLLWRLRYPLCLRSLWRSQTRLSSQRPRRLLRKKSRI